MSKNGNLHAAKVNANDEFYTQYQDISNECNHYRQHFKGKTILCNCDDPSWSNFWRYFHNNFASFGLRKLISTHYQQGSEPSYAMIYEGGNDFDMKAGTIVEIYGDDKYTAGDFRSKDCIEFLKEADIVVTNPPFSLFREYIKQLVDYGKSFIIIGNVNAVTYKEVFPLIKNNKVWLGASIHSGDRKFYVPDNYPLNAAGCGIDEDGKRFIRVKGVRWFTNLDMSQRHDGLWHIGDKFDQTKAHVYYEGFEHLYPKYDNYDAINVDKTKDIPIDYHGVMGVPITWLDKYNPNEFEIIDSNTIFKSEKKKNTMLIKDKDSAINGKPTYARICIRNRNPILKSEDKGY